jgi:hypothetical protein
LSAKEQAESDRTREQVNPSSMCRIHAECGRDQKLTIMNPCTDIGLPSSHD